MLERRTYDEFIFANASFGLYSNERLFLGRFITGHAFRSAPLKRAT